MSLSHPEIEYRPAFRGENISRRQHTTLVDLLEVYHENALWKPRLDHQQLLGHLTAGDVPGSEPPLRILFIHDLNFRHSNDTLLLSVGTTAHWLHQRFNVSPLFLQSIVVPNYVVKIGNATFLHQDENGEPKSLDGVYRMSAGLGGSPAHVWYSHGLRGRSSIYIINQCPKGAMDILLANAQDQHVSALLRPFAIDAFLSEDCLHEWCESLTPPRNELVVYEQTATAGITPQQMGEVVERLHNLSQRLHIIREDLTDLEERIKYHITTHQQYIGLSKSQTSNSVHESFSYLTSKTNIMRRWATNYAERTNIRINLFFNLANQLDNRTNLDIARLTSGIAVSTQRDSSSMITMATVTMFFLPGTFVSAFFSMVFFEIQDGVPSLVVGPQWWLFFAVTVPLTIVVFVVWLFWQRYRNKADLPQLDIKRPAVESTRISPNESAMSF